MKRFADSWFSLLCVALVLAIACLATAGPTVASAGGGTPNGKYHNETHQGGTMHCDPIPYDCWCSPSPCSG